VGGSGQYSVLDDDPRIHRFVSFLAEISTTGFPVFASCFGFQAIVLGLGGEVVADEDNAEVGSYDLELTDEGAADPLFSALPREFIAQLGHKDQARRYPSGMLNLASSPRTPRQAFRLVGFPVYGTQFHPELTWQENRARFQRYMKEYGKLFGAEAAQRQLDSHRPSLESNNLLGAFVDLFVKPDLALSAAGGDEPDDAPFNDGRGPLISRES
jgi:GMP synthase (glutamine-hydrolysing)